MEPIRTFLGALWRRPDGAAPAGDPGHPRRGERGQVLPIFVFISVVALGGAALLADAAWWWTMEQKAQRAADAGALAGAVYLPAEQGVAFAAAIAEAGKNGFVNGRDGVVVTPRRDATNPRKLIVDIETPVETFFAKAFSIASVDVGVTGAGEYTLPVPMGSPENYYGVFGILRDATFTEQRTVTISDDGETGWDSPTAHQGVSGSTNWSNPTSAYNGGDTSASSNGQSHVWRSFNLTSGSGGIPNEASLTVDGLQVRLRGAELNGSGTSSNCRITVQLTRNVAAGGGGPTWLSSVQTPPLGDNDGDYVLGVVDSTTAWGGGTWTRNDFGNNNFGVRLTWNEGGTGCSTNRSVAVNEIEVQVYYSWTRTVTQNVTETTSDPLRGPGTACANGAPNCFNPDGDDLNPRGFWATMNTRGASNVNGDAHQPRYINPTSGLAPECNTPEADGNACHDPTVYYNYAVEMAPGSSNGFVYVFDPGFCATENDRGVGDRWYSGSAAVSSWYELYEDTNNTPYDLSDDTKIASSGSLFTNLNGRDSTMGGGSGTECRKNDTGYGDGRDYHLSWFLLNPDRPLSGGSNGRVYRLHTTGTDPAGNLLSNANGEQSFALFAKSTGTAPRIYGMAAMQMYTPLSSSGGSTSSEFYLAQIDEAHAGKTVELKLWDPGDTAPLRAHLEILVPRNGGGWAASDRLSYSARTGTTHSERNNACNSNAAEDVSSILTNRGTNTVGEFNGCWLTVYIPIPLDYTAGEDGWWKIRYNMSGSGTSNDVTTWKVAVIGNPVHLIPE